jgi:hypothetical protein
VNDQFGQDGETFQYPFALDENNYIVAYIPEGGAKKYTNEKTKFRLVCTG